MKRSKSIWNVISVVIIASMLATTLPPGAFGNPSQALADSGDPPFYDLGAWSTTVDGDVSHALIEGPDGKLYGGTHGGRTRNAHLFSYEPGVGFTDLGQVSPGNPDLYVSAMTVDSDGNLYIGTSTHGCLAKYDPANDTMNNIECGVAGGRYINQLLESPGGKIYGTTAFNGHLFTYDPVSGTINDLGRVASSEYAIFGLAFDSSGQNVFVTSSHEPAYGGTGSLYGYNLELEEITPLGALVEDARYASYNVVTGPDDLVYGGAGTTNGEGHLWRFDPENPDTPEDLGTVTGESKVDFLAVGSDGKIYATTSPNGHLVVFDSNRREAGIVDLGQIGDVEFNPIALGPDDHLYLGVGNHLYTYDTSGEEEAEAGEGEPEATEEPEAGEVEPEATEEPEAGEAEPEATAEPEVDEGEPGEQTILLEPISDAETPAELIPMVVAANDQCQVMVVYQAKQDGTVHLYSALNSGSSWETIEVPLPASYTTWGSVHLHDLAAHGSQFALLLDRSNKYYYTVWSAGSWSTPEEIPSSYRCKRINFDAQGNLIFFKHPDKKFIRLVDGQFESLTLPEQVSDPGEAQRTSIYRGRTGAIHIVGMGSGASVPAVASLPAGADAMQTANWVFNPPSNNDNSAPVGSSGRQLAVDWPNQKVWATWKEQDTLYVAHAPLGAASEAAWQIWGISPPEGFDFYQGSWLASSGAGAVGIVYSVRNLDASPTERRLVFRWLLPTGVGEPINLDRPGTQTEAAQFTDIRQPNMAIGPDGTAHVVAVAKKLGEIPAGVNRIFYARITGGAVVANEPGVSGGSEQVAVAQCAYEAAGAEEEGDKPDLVATIEVTGSHGKPTIRDGKIVHRYRSGASSSGLVYLDVTVSNNGAEYYGDLWADVVADGAVWHYHYPDYSNGGQPLFERDESKGLGKLPRLEYKYRLQEGWEPPEVEVEHPSGSFGRPFVSMYSGLGRKTITVTVDPDNLIDEENEDNNVATLQYEISHGKKSDDKIEVDLADGGTWQVGVNDLAILGAKLLDNTPTAPWLGLVKRPTEARVIVGNPREASFFRDVPVVALIDGLEIHREIIPLVDDTPQMTEQELQWLGVSGSLPGDADAACAGYISVPVDLTSTAVGTHTLTLSVDPDDEFADLDRANNTYSTEFYVREPGGTLKVTVQDDSDHHGLSKARVMLPGLYFGTCDENGYVEIPDVPVGSYEPEDLWAHRRWSEPRYGEQHADTGFTMQNNQEEEITLELGLPVHVIVKLFDQLTGEEVSEPINASLEHLEETRSGAVLDTSYARPLRGSDGYIHFVDVPPGSCAITGGAYAFESETITTTIQRDENNEFTVPITLTRAPRGTIAGTVEDLDGNTVSGVTVWLDGVPRSAESDSDGNFTITEVQAGRTYQVIGRKPSYESARALSGIVSPASTETVSLQMRSITQMEKFLDFDAVAWMMLETWPGFNFFDKVTSQSTQVKAQFGEFSASLGMLYYEVQGQDEMVLSEVIIAVRGGPFWRERCSFEYDLLSLAGDAWSDFKEELATAMFGEDLGEMALAAVDLIDPHEKACEWGILQALDNPLENLYPISIPQSAFGEIPGPLEASCWAHEYANDFLTDEVDYNQLHDGQVVGAFSSQSGEEYPKASLIEMPNYTNVEVGPEFMGGITVVRCDIVEVKVVDGDTSETIDTIHRSFYSPKMAVYTIGTPITETELENLEITFYITVLNQNLSPGPLYANSQNVLIWRPFKDNQLTFHAWPYNPLPE